MRNPAGLCFPFSLRRASEINQDSALRKGFSNAHGLHIARCIGSDMNHFGGDRALDERGDLRGAFRERRRLVRKRVCYHSVYVLASVESGERRGEYLACRAPKANRIRIRYLRCQERIRIHLGTVEHLIISSHWRDRLTF